MIARSTDASRRGLAYVCNPTTGAVENFGQLAWCIKSYDVLVDLGRFGVMRSQQQERRTLRQTLASRSTWTLR